MKVITGKKAILIRSQVLTEPKFLLMNKFHLRCCERTAKPGFEWTVKADIWKVEFLAAGKAHRATF